MYIFKSNINQKEYDHFVENHPSCSLLQSYKWANIKNNWNSIYTGVYEKDTLVAAGLVLIRPLPLSFSMFYFYFPFHDVAVFSTTSFNSSIFFLPTVFNQFTAASTPSLANTSTPSAQVALPHNTPLNFAPES